MLFRLEPEAAGYADGILRIRVGADVGPPVQAKGEVFPDPPFSPEAEEERVAVQTGGIGPEGASAGGEGGG